MDDAAEAITAVAENAAGDAGDGNHRKKRCSPKPAKNVFLPRKVFQLRPAPRHAGEPSAQAQALVVRILAGEIGPVLSLRTSLPDCKGPDLQALLGALVDCQSVHFLSIGCSGALATSPGLASLLVQVLLRGFIWACDLGELYFRWDVMEGMLAGLEGPAPHRQPLSNLAFVFADKGCGIDANHVARFKRLTRQRRLLDKSLPSSQVSRRCAPWLDVPTVFGMVMHSKNLTKCFWRPYQEPDFWRRAGFHCSSVRRPSETPGKWVNPALRRLTTAMHRGNLDPIALQEAFPPGVEGLRRSKALLEACLSRKLPPAPLPQWVLPGKKASRKAAKTELEPQPVFREGLLKRRRQQDIGVQSLVILDD